MLDLTLKWYLERDGSKLIVHDITGAFDPNNTGGYGGDNANRSSFAFVLYPRYKPTTSDPIDIGVLNNAYKDGKIALNYDEAHPNNYETIIEFPTEKDGVYDINAFLVPTTVAGNAGDIYYNTTSGLIEEYQDDLTIAELTDYNKLFNVQKLIQVNCSEIVMNRTYLCASRFFRYYLQYDENDPDCNEAKIYWKKWLTTMGQLWGAFDNQRGGYKIEAQEIMEGLDNVCNNM